MADFRLDRLGPLDNPDARFRFLWQKMCEKVEEAFDQLAERVTDIEDLLEATAAAQAAADNANAAADAVTSASALGSSYVSGVTISASDAGTNVTITISAHTRHYPQVDGTTVDVAVGAGSILGLSYTTDYYIYYDDAGRTGGAVSYLSTTSEATAAQTGARHTVGLVTTPAAAGAATGGSYTRPPGPGQISRL